MYKIPNVVINRLNKQIPIFKRIFVDAQNRDVNESDTVTIITDMLQDVFGFDKYTEITREFAIQGTYCDLAVKINDAVQYLIEVKAIGISLKENHIRQAVNYAAKHGVSWVVLTNGIDWQLYKVSVEGKVTSEIISSFSLLDINVKSQSDLNLLFMLCRRGTDKNLIQEYYEYRQSINKQMITAVIASDPVISVVRRELKKIKNGLKVKDDEIRAILLDQIVKRELIESDELKKSMLTVKKLAKKTAQKKTKAIHSSNSVEQNEEGAEVT